MMCSKCTKVSGGLLLLAGLLFLLQDLGVWAFWDLNWWTVALLLMGTIKLASNSCADCHKECDSGKKKK